MITALPDVLPAAPFLLPRMLPSPLFSYSSFFLLTMTALAVPVIPELVAVSELNAPAPLTFPNVTARATPWPRHLSNGR